MNEIVLAILAIFWGIVLMLPGDLFNGIERYKYFSSFAPDSVWGMVMILGGLTTLIARPPWLRRNAHALLCIVWLGMTVLSCLSIVTAPSLLITSIILTVALLHAMKFWRLSRPMEIL
jgi:putative effector of murein hydrolase LrgA (UPF0299 family)